MVKVREDHPIQADGSVDLEMWLERLQEQVDVKDIDTVRQACLYAQQLKDEAEPSEGSWSDCDSYLTGLEMAQILVELNQDQDALVAAILYRSVREKRTTLEDIRRRFGQTITSLIDGVLQMAAIGSRQNPRRENVLGQSGNPLDNVRKMLVSMIDDVRVVLIKIAERTCAIRRVKGDSRKKRYLVAREVFDVYAPLAHRLGIGQIKWELEDLSFRYLKPNDYKQIASLLDEKRLDRQQFIEDSVNILNTELEKVNIEGDVMGRAKHIYSIWRKMQRKNIAFNQVYDIRAVRILVPEIRDCYTVLGIVHGLWRNIPHEFDDYIASPKPNGYRSLHTAVFGPSGKVLEIQIRTFSMHEEAELGVCAHWLYKGTDTQTTSTSYEEKIAWLRQVLEWTEDLGESEAFSEVLSGDVAHDRVYVFTPDGHVVDMPVKSTPVDFAYRVHTEVGHRCRGAKVNGRIVPLTRQLQTGDQVEILTANEEHPRRDWLNPNLGYITSARSRAKVQHWFKLQDKDKNAAAGKKIIDREFRRLALESNDLNFSKMAKAVNHRTAEDMYASLGAGDIRLSQVINAAQQQVESDHNHDAQLDLALPNNSGRAQRDSVGSDGINIRGVGNLLTTIAPCCKPVPGDLIIGYITKNRGVSIHREDCINVFQLRQHEGERVVEVSWGEEAESTYPVDIYVEAFDRAGLLRDLMMVMANENVNLVAAHTQSDKKSNIAQLTLTIEISRLELLGKIMDKINQIPNVTDVHRQRSGS
ncbi:GTP diphosphokinase [Amphritea sp. 2_MG-2023]|uniref:GTP diphosphokinase n=1 Tax=Amphritea TaxID=515417 RepID=UPI001C065363|nr:GTP diphosphokinase [Amphritea sp. 2_MG-2023]MBU2967531.1 GTP diphosphokinase [Amphritea atlantica]MDO6420537.1 GTP diphosphokinase [Amphritea sp. 2_MG-2023]